MQVISIQSQVCAGRVGNSAASFPLESAGLDVITIPTALLSNHPGHGGFTGNILPGEEVQDLLQGVMDHINPAHCAAILSGYLGTVTTASAVLTTVNQIKRAAPKAIYCCDPVVGDYPVGLYVQEEIAQAFPKDLFPKADILTPNAFELAYFTGTTPRTLEEATKAAKSLHDYGPAMILCSSLATTDTPKGKLDALLSIKGDCYILRVDKAIGATSGAGDLLTSLFLADLLTGQEPLDAFQHAMAVTASTVTYAAQNGLTDLPPPNLSQEIITPEIIMCD